MKWFLTFIGAWALTGAGATLVVGTFIEKSVAELRHKEVQEAFERGVESVKASDLALLDEKKTNEVCTAWWFDMTHKQRKLKVPKRRSLP